MAKKNRKQIGAFDIPELRNPSKTLLANIRFSALDDEIKTVVVTSSIMDEGKSTVCSNLACAMASSGKRTLIVDCDMRRRSMGSMMNLRGSAGLYAVLAGESSLNDAIITTEIPNLYFLDCEPNVPNPPDILSTKRFSVLLDKLRTIFDYVILDSPPVGLFVDSSIIANQVDGTILVVRQNFAKRKDVQAAVSQLKAADANILGTVLSFVPKEDNDYYYYSYYYYNDEDGSKKKREHKTTELEVVDSQIADDDVSSWAKRIDANQSAATGAENGKGGRHGRSAADSNPFAPGSFKSHK